MLIVVPIDICDASKEAIKYCKNLKNSFKEKPEIIFINVTGINPKSSIPILNDLDQSFNKEIKYKSNKEIEEIKSVLMKNGFDPLKHFRHLTIEDETAKAILTVIEAEYPEIDMCIVGTNNREGIKKWIMGSVSEYLLHHLNCPVTIIKKK